MTRIKNSVYYRNIQKMADKTVGFDWDKGNLEKSWLKHGVRQNESEAVFVDRESIVSEDPKHSQIEKRWLLLGKTKQGKYLAVVFTKRQNKIRVISARPMNQKERRLYEKK